MTTMKSSHGIAALLFLLATPLVAQSSRLNLIVDVEGLRQTGSRPALRAGDSSIDPQFRTAGGAGIGLDWFLSRHVSFEGKIAVVQSKLHLRVLGTDSALNLDLGNEPIYPVTALLKYHFANENVGVRPYVEAGAGYIILKNIQNNGLLGMDGKVRFHDPTGLVVGAGLVVNVSSRWGFIADARYIPIESQASATLSGSSGRPRRIDVKPLIGSFGLVYRF
jgi:outer membrane protein W